MRYESEEFKNMDLDQDHLEDSVFEDCAFTNAGSARRNCSTAVFGLLL